MILKMIHFFILLIFIFSGSNSLAETQLKDSKVLLFCGYTGSKNQAIVIESDTALHNETAIDLFDDTKSVNYDNIPGTIYFFDNFKLPTPQSSNFDQQKNELTKMTKYGYLAKYPGTIGKSGFNFGYNHDSGNGNGNHSFTLFYTRYKTNKDQLARIDFGSEFKENRQFRGVYKCHHEIVDFEPKNETFAEVIPDDQFLHDGSSDEDSED